MFCGGVALRAFADLSIGVVTPAGGVALMLGWVALAAAGLGRAR
jgi:uncharacterized membrane protein YgdD (TMEM256/DUF423 family)